MEDDIDRKTNSQESDSIPVSLNAEGSEDDAPEEFCCGITREVMVDPVLLVHSGMSYERVAIEKWLKISKKCPLSGKFSSIPRVVENINLRKAIRNFFEIRRWQRDSFWRIQPDRLTRLELIGRGAQGDVWAAQLQYPKFNVRVAMKMLPKPSCSGELNSMEAELRTMQDLTTTCDNVCRLLGVSEYNGEPCLVMKLYQKNLRQVAHARGGVLPEEDAIRYAIDVSRAMWGIHHLGKLHLDLKPENILWDEETDSVVVSDFGVTQTITKTVATLTQYKGTPNYSSPEAFDEHVSFKSDVWSFACTFLEMATGKQPWQGLTMVQIARRVAVDKLKPDGISELSPALADLLDRCFSHDAGERPSFEVIHKELSSMLRAAPFRSQGVSSDSLNCELSFQSGASSNETQSGKLGFTRSLPAELEGTNLMGWFEATRQLVANMEGNDSGPNLRTGLKMIFEGMRSHATNASVQEEGCEALRLLAQCGPMVAKRIVSEDGIELVMEAMSKHIDNEDVQLQSSGAIWALTREEGEGREKACELGAIACLKNALRVHSGNTTLQHQALKAILNLVKGNEGAASKFSQERGFEILLETLRFHSDAVEVQESSLSVLSALLELEKDNALISTAFLNDPSLDSLVVCMSNFLVSKRVFRDLSSCFARLASANAEIKSWLGRSRAMALICNGLKLSRSSVTVQEIGLLALVALVRGSSINAEKLCKERGMELALAAVRTHRSVTGVVEMGLELMGLLVEERACDTSGVKQKDATCMMLELVGSADKQIAQRSMAFVRKLVQREESMKDTMVEMGMHRAMLARGKDCAEDGEMCGVVCHGVEALITSSNSQRLLEEGLVEEGSRGGRGGGEKGDGDAEPPCQRQRRRSSEAAGCWRRRSCPADDEAAHGEGERGRAELLHPVGLVLVLRGAGAADGQRRNAAAAPEYGATQAERSDSAARGDGVGGGWLGEEMKDSIVLPFEVSTTLLFIRDHAAS
eukprot:768317-Hanusia_phi.AAC.11